MPERKSTDRARKALAKARRIEANEREQNAIALGRYTPEQVSDMARWRDDADAFMAENLWVPNIDGGAVIPFTANAGQVVLAGEITKLRARGAPVRVICLKSRKHGISTWAQGRAYAFTSTREYVNGLVIAHKKDSTSAIFETAKKFHMLDERRAVGLRPMLETSNRLELKFGNPDPRTRELFPGLQSKLEITSAESKEPGRSGTYHFVHASEVAFWPDAGVWTAVGPALMDAPDTFAIMESTANGVGGLFYDTWIAAMEGRNDWHPVFLSWLIDPRCRRALTPEEKASFDWVSKDEREYAERYHLTLEQVKFRRLKLADPSMKKPGKLPDDVFDEEYPASPEIAFKGSGKTFFLARTLEALEKDPERGVRPPIWRGQIRNRTSLEKRGPGLPEVPIDIVREEDPHGPLRVWALPQPDREYVVGADIAEGLLHGDNHAIVVLDRHDLEIVAVWKTNQATSRVAGQVACLLGWWYGDADIPCLVGIELNAHGVAATQEAVRIMYPNLWHHRDVRKEGETPKDRPGWITTEGVRTYMLETVEFEIQALTPRIHHAEFYKEARTFENIDGKPQARSGCHDDEILGTAIAFQMHLHSGPPRRVPTPQEKPVVRHARVLLPDVPEQGKVPISQFSGRLTRIAKRDIWG